ncbi:PAS domain-containing sensor histidine kinase [Methanolobus mangrovi]|uniref:histidine kinase n=1 Tax=Methanolobus mangrovi TaxID=3072977 RepID=A0AA51UH24_9EURY|nr:PAS domain-containing sensor histidine kinase [Methanolobus mangrovi]WMW22838.1 PAS domain-containing sensor histidine kinase [Methanolobus mangrovi]
MNGYSSNTEHSIAGIADLVDTILDETSVEEMLKILVERIPSLFSEPENMSVKISWLDEHCESDSYSKPGIILTSDITVNGKKEGFIEIIIAGKDTEIENNADLIHNYEKMLHLISRMISLFFEKRKKVMELDNIEKKMRSYCNKLEDYLFVVNSNGNILDFNTSFETCTGYTAEELHQMNIKDLLTQCSDNFENSPMIKDAAVKGSSTFEFDHRCKSGEIVPMSITCKPLANNDEKTFICVARNISEAKKAELELQESERKYSTIVEKGNDGIIIVQKGLVRFANSKALDITGYEYEDIINERYLKLIPTEDHQRSIEWLNQCNSNIANKAIFHVDLLTKNKQELPVEITGSVIDYEGSEAKLLILRDISERKCIEDILKQERDKLENYLDVAGSIIGIVGVDTNITFVNKKGAEVLGYTKDEIIGASWFDKFLPESVRDITRENFIKVINGEIDPPEYFENLILTKSGEERLIFWHDVPLEDENGKRIGVISSGEDITESRKMEAMLVESENNLKTIFNNIDDLISIHKPHGKFIDVNKAAVSSTGYTKDEMLEMSPKDLVWPGMRPMMDGYTERIMKEKNIIFEIYDVHKNGSLLPHEVNSRLIEYKGEQAIISVARDITERKKAEERLKRYAGELKHSNELKDLFTDIIRHDLLTPASVVKGYTEELIMTINDENALKLAEKVRDNNDRLIELLETATKLAKLQKNEDIVFENMDIVPIFKMVLDSFKTQHEMKEHEIVFTADGPCPSVVNTVIEEVFANLLSNAIKYSPPKSRIEITFSDENNMWKTSVTDFGIGISDKDKPLLFNRFHRADKKGIKGTGLGLAIVKRIIELHGGKYGVEDNPAGHGSVFWVMLKKA